MVKKLIVILFSLILSACGGSGPDPTLQIPTPTPTPSYGYCGDQSTTAPDVSQQLSWPHYAADLASSRYLPTSKITEGNFNSMTLAWKWCSSIEDVLIENTAIEIDRNEVTPIMIDGVLYASTQLSQVAAINPTDGKTIWLFDPESHLAGRPPNHGFLHRGVAYWSDGVEKRIFIGTGDSYLYSIDAVNGEIDSNFGDVGKINLREGLGRTINNEYYGVNSPPLVCKDTVIVGSSVHDFPMELLMPPGDVRAFDALNGDLKWQFHIVPHLGEYGSETWENMSNENAAGANVWSWMSCDEELGLVYLPTTTPTNDHYGGDRYGDNLFAESIVAIDLETGERKWHFQTVHHGLWDYDLPAAPNLVDVITNEGTEKLLAQISKNAFTYVFDRETGTPKWPIEEKAVPQSTIPSEKTSLTQPFPSKPAPFDHQGINADNLINFTYELRSKALDIVSQYDYGELYLPPSDLGALAVPSIAGGGSWSGAGYHPEKNILFVPSVTLPFVTRIERSGLQIIQNRDYVHGPDGLPLMRPPYGRVTAISMDTGEHLWVAPVGNGYESNSAIADLNLSDLGYHQRIFVAVTKNLLLTAQQKLAAFNLDTGEKIGDHDLPGDAMGAPMVFELNDKVYVVVAVGDSETQSELLAFTLDE